MRAIAARARTHIVRFALLATLAPVAARAQDFKRVVPKLPPPLATPKVDVPPETQPVRPDETVLLPRLNGVVLVGNPSAIQTSGITPDAVVERIAARGLPLLAGDDFRRRASAYLDRPFTRADLDSLTRLVRETFRAGQHPFVDVSIPPQNVQTGVIQILVTEYRVGEIGVSGNRYFSAGRIRGMSDLRSGEPLSLPRLREALDDYNQNPFLTVNAVVKPGSTTGLTDLTLEAKDRLPLRVYAGYDNLGVPTLGRDEWYVGLNVGNVFGTGQLLSYQYTRSFKNRYISHSLSDVIPVSPNDRILLFGAFATQKPFIDIAFNSVGHSAQASTRYVHDLGGGTGAKESLQIGADYKRTDNNLEFFGFRILDTTVEVVQFPLIYTGAFSDRLGRTVIENQLVFSPGNITRYNNDASMRLLVPGAHVRYIYDRLSITRTTYLPYRLSWVVRGMAQYASANLPYSEQLAGGGLGSVRGYDSNTALGSEGVLLSTELRSPAFNLFAFGPGKSVKDQLQLGVFLDYSYIRQHDRVLDVGGYTQLASAGFNVHYNVSRFLDLQLEVGRQLMRTRFQPQRQTRAAIIATIGF